MKKVSLTSFLIPLTLVICSGCSHKAELDPPGTLHLFTEEKTEVLDPVFSTDLYSSKQVSQAYETLYKYHYLKRPYALEPLLAASLPKASQDGLTHLIQIKKGVFFQDDSCFKSTLGKGREFNADDVVYSFKRVLDPRIGSRGYTLFENLFVGAKEWRLALAQSTNPLSLDRTVLDGIQAVGRYTLKIKLNHPVGHLMDALALSYTAIVPMEAVEFYGSEFSERAVGTGPFRLTGFDPGKKIIWDKNPNFRRETFPSGSSKEDKAQGILESENTVIPLVNRIIFTVLSDQDQVWKAFSENKLDVIDSMRNYFPQAINDEEGLEPEFAKKGIRLHKTLLADVTHITFNLNDPILGKNKLLRQAISLAYDERTFINLFYHGRAIEAQGAIPPGVFGYDPNYRNHFRRFDRKAAQNLLSQAGYPDGKGLPPLTYASLNDKAGIQQGEFLAKMLKEIGIQVKLSVYSWADLKNAIRKKEIQMWEQAWLADYPDASNFYQLFLTKNRDNPDLNDSGYSNTEFDQIYDQMIQLPNTNQKMHLLTKMGEILAEDCPWIFKSHRSKYALVQPWIKNFKINDFDPYSYRYFKISR